MSLVSAPTRSPAALASVISSMVGGAQPLVLRQLVEPVHQGPGVPGLAHRGAPIRAARCAQ